LADLDDQIKLQNREPSDCRLNCGVTQVEAKEIQLKGLEGVQAVKTSWLNVFSDVVDSQILSQTEPFSGPKRLSLVRFLQKDKTDWLGGLWDGGCESDPTAHVSEPGE